MKSQIDDYSFEHFQLLCRYLATNKEHGLITLTPKLPRKIYQIMKVWSFIEQHHQDLKNIFKQMMNIIYTCIVQTQHNKFYTFNYVLREWKKIHPLNQVNLQKYQHPPTQKLSIISEYLSSLKDDSQKDNSQEIEEDIEAISFHEKLLPDPECVNCSQVFYYGEKPFTFYIYERIILFQNKNRKNLNKLGEIMCALMNERKGGYILIGMENQKLIGKKYSAKKEQRQKQIIRTGFDNIFPELIGDSLDTSLVPLVDDKGSEIAHLVRIYVKPNDSGPFFLMDKRQGSLLYDFFYFENDKITKVTGTKIYQCIQQVYEWKKKPYIKDHTICRKPRIKNYVDEDSSDPEEIQDQEPKFEHHYQSILIAGSPKQDYIIENLQKQLKEKKSKFTLMKPFGSLRKASTHSIWFISHSDRFDFVSGILKLVDKGKSVAFFTVQKNLLMEENFTKKPNYKETLIKLQELVKQRYKKKIQIRQQQYVEKQYKSMRLFIRFGSFEQSIMGFVFLINCGFKSTFVKNKLFASSYY